MILYSPEGVAVPCDADQKAILLAAGFTIDKPESKEPEKKEGDESKEVIDDFDYKTTEEIDSMTIKNRRIYDEALQAHKAKLAGA